MAKNRSKKTKDIISQLKEEGHSFSPVPENKEDEDKPRKKKKGKPLRKFVPPTDIGGAY